MLPNNITKKKKNINQRHTTSHIHVSALDCCYMMWSVWTTSKLQTETDDFKRTIYHTPTAYIKCFLWYRVGCKKVAVFRFARVLVIFSLALVRILRTVFEQLVNSRAVTTPPLPLVILDRVLLVTFNIFNDGLSFRHLATVLTFSCLMTYIYMSYRTANLQMLHFIYLFNKYTYWIF